MITEKICTSTGDSNCCNTASIACAPSHLGTFNIAFGSMSSKNKYFISKDDFKNYAIPGSIKYIDFKHNGEVKEVYIKEVLYSPPATIVFWSDDTKTSSKSDDMDAYNPYAGIAFCVLKKMYGGDEVAALIDTWGPDIFELARLYETNGKKKNKPLRKTLTEIRRLLRLKNKNKKDGSTI